MQERVGIRLVCSSIGQSPLPPCPFQLGVFALIWSTQAEPHLSGHGAASCSPPCQRAAGLRTVLSTAFDDLWAHEWAHGPLTVRDCSIVSVCWLAECNSGSGCLLRPLPCSRARSHRMSRSRGKRMVRPNVREGMLGSSLTHRQIDLTETCSMAATSWPVRYSGVASPLGMIGLSCPFMRYLRVSSPLANIQRFAAFPG